MFERNLTLLTDLYELTMMQGYFKEQDHDKVVVFDVFIVLTRATTAIPSLPDWSRSSIISKVFIFLTKQSTI